MNDDIKCSIIRWMNSRMTFADIALVARVAGVDVRTLVALHPSFNLTEEVHRLAP